MSQINVTNIQHESGAGSNITLDDQGNVDVAGNVVAAGDVQMASLNGGPLAGFRNKVINGCFRVWARGTECTNPGGRRYTADRWKETSATVGAVVKRSTNAPAGFTYSAELDANSGAFQQGIELDEPNTNGIFAIGSQWTLSVYANKDITDYTTQLKFRRENGMSNYQTLASEEGNYELIPDTESNGFNRYKITFTITGDNTEATGGNKIMLAFSLISGTSQGGISVTGAQLEPGPICTPFEHRSIGLETSLCMRYFYRMVQPTTGQVSTVPFVMHQTSSGNARGSWMPFVPFRASPTLTVGGDISDFKLTGGGQQQTCTDMGAYSLSHKNGAVGIFTNQSGGTSPGNYQMVSVRFGEDGKWIDFDAEF